MLRETTALLVLFCRYMAELGKHVPIIPVIMKADTMTIREANNYKQEVFNRLQVSKVARGLLALFKTGLH